MRFALILFAIMMLGVFAIIGTVDSGTDSAVAGTASPSIEPHATACGDDGDEGDGDPPDEPDIDDSVFGILSDDDDEETGNRGEPADNEDGDPIDEYDDCFPFGPEPTVGGEIETPLPTDSPTPEPCQTLQSGTASEECCELFDGVAAQESCYCDLGPSCCAAVEACSGDTESEAVAQPADFNCDGNVTTEDALGILQTIGGPDSEDYGDDCPDSEDLPGDVDCDDEIGVKDAIGVLSVVAGFDDEDGCDVR